MTIAKQRGGTTKPVISTRRKGGHGRGGEERKRKRKKGEGGCELTTGKLDELHGKPIWRSVAVTIKITVDVDVGDCCTHDVPRRQDIYIYYMYIYIYMYTDGAGSLESELKARSPLLNRA